MQSFREIVNAVSPTFCRRSLHHSLCAKTKQTMKNKILDGLLNKIAISILMILLQKLEILLNQDLNGDNKIG